MTGSFTQTVVPVSKVEKLKEEPKKAEEEQANMAAQVRTGKTCHTNNVQFWTGCD